MNSFIFTTTIFISLSSIYTYPIDPFQSIDNHEDNKEWTHASTKSTVSMTTPRLIGDTPREDENENEEMDGEENREDSDELSTSLEAPKEEEVMRE